MQKRGFTIIEVVVVFLIILGFAFFIIPKSMENTKQARLISKWIEKYSDLEYMFSVIKAQEDSKLKEDFAKAQDNDQMNQVLLDVIKPYLRITSQLNSPDYQQFYMNQSKVREGDGYYFKNLYLTSSNEIVGLKWDKKDCQGDDVCAVLSFDLNGVALPNSWGYDIFGINILKNKIEPIGKQADSTTLKANCSKHGFGVYCSYYYLIGGKFD